MKTISKLGACLLALWCSSLLAPVVAAQAPEQEPAPAPAPAPAPPVEPSNPSNIYYGGTIGFSFGDYFRISVQPWVGYKLSPKTSVGAKIGYEYIEDERYDPTLKASNYGASVFSRYRLLPQLYAHGEFAYFSYEYRTATAESDRSWVPFLLLGGGVVQPISPNTSFIFEVLFDVLQDSDSPYEDWTPFISIGVGVGL